jgi:hypothetical protein
MEQVSHFPKVWFARGKGTIHLFWPDFSSIMRYDNEKEIIPCWSWDQIYQTYQRLLFRLHYGDYDWEGDGQFDLNGIVRRIGNFWKNPFLSLTDIQLLYYEEYECHWLLNLGRFLEYQLKPSQPGVENVNWKGIFPIRDRRLSRPQIPIPITHLPIYIHIMQWAWAQGLGSGRMLFIQLRSGLHLMTNVSPVTAWRLKG